MEPMEIALLPLEGGHALVAEVGVFAIGKDAEAAQALGQRLYAHLGLPVVPLVVGGPGGATTRGLAPGEPGGAPAPPPPGPHPRGGAGPGPLPGGRGTQARGAASPARQPFPQAFSSRRTALRTLAPSGPRTPSPGKPKAPPGRGAVFVRGGDWRNREVVAPSAGEAPSLPVPPRPPSPRGPRPLLPPPAPGLASRPPRPLRRLDPSARPGGLGPCPGLPPHPGPPPQAGGLGLGLDWGLPAGGLRGEPHPLPGGGPPLPPGGLPHGGPGLGPLPSLWGLWPSTAPCPWGRPRGSTPWPGGTPSFGLGPSPPWPSTWGRPSLGSCSWCPPSSGLWEGTWTHT